MTNREFYEAVINANINEEVTAHATALRDKLDATNAKRSAKQTEKQNENLAQMKELVGYLTTDPQTASDLMGCIGESVQKTSYLLRLAVKEGEANVTDVKVPKKGVQKGYFLSANDTEADVESDPDESDPVF